MKQRKLLFFTAIFFVFLDYGNAQLSYGKKVVKKLSSKNMHGRGYVKRGDLKAAKYISNEFKKIGLLKYNDSYFQKFDFPVNTQPNKMKLILNDTLELVPGVEFLINPASPSIKGSYPTVLFTSEDLLNINRLNEKLVDSNGKIILINNYDIDDFNKDEKSKISIVINFLKNNPENPAIATILFTHKKLTWSGSTIQNKNASFTINKKIDITQINRVTLNCDSEFQEKYTSQNCIGYIKGSSKTDSTVVVTAHYDHLGKMGKKTFFPGANDNASGVALLLNQAKYFSKKENKPKYNIVFIAFGGEEIGLLGSRFFTEYPLIDLSKIKLLLNFDLAGTGDEGIKVVNGKEFTNHFNKLIEINSTYNLLTNIYPRGKACNSDHCFFYEKGIPSLYIYTLGGIKAYHDIYDKYETLPFTEFEDYNMLIQQFIKQL